MKELIFKEIVYDSANYQLTVQLRDQLLRKPLGLKFSEEDLASEKQMFHLALFDDNECIACLILVPEAEKIKMRQVAVAEKYQSKGIGKKLIQESEAFAKAKEFQKMYCNARKTAVPFYLKQGYKIVSEEFEEVGIPHFKMEKELS